ncbi:C2H2 and C2HC zinc finger [Rhypophila sp. PSN 637]
MERLGLLFATNKPYPWNLQTILCWDRILVSRQHSHGDLEGQLGTRQALFYAFYCRSSFAVRLSQLALASIDLLPPKPALPPTMTPPDLDALFSYFTGNPDVNAVLTALDAATVRQQAKVFSSQIHRDHALLRSIIERHESKIQRRWEKKSKSQRLTVLLSAWPHSMPATHRPDWAILRRFRKEGNKANLRHHLGRHRGAFLWPYINQEDLVKTRALLLLLKSRARNHPSLFAGADAAAMNLGAVRNAIEPDILSAFVMMLNGMTSQDEYGKLVFWPVEQPDKIRDWFLKKQQFLPGEGLLVLEAQAGLLAFLLSCCHQILHDISPDKLASQEFPVEPEPAVKDKRAGTVDLLPSLLELAEEAPYTCQHLDLNNTISLLAAGLARTQDHIWTLREDPGYYVEQLVEDKEHRAELIKDVNGALDPFLKTDDFWAALIFVFLTVSLSKLEEFTDLHNQALELRALQAKHETRGEIKFGSALPSEYMTALLIFRKSLQQTADFYLAHLAPMHMCVRLGGADSAEISFQRIEKVDTTVLDLYDIFKVFSHQTSELGDLGYPIFADQVERLIRADPKAKELLSPLVARSIGELSILGECMRQIDTYPPWVREFAWAAHVSNKTVWIECAKKAQPSFDIALALSASKLEKAGIGHILGQPGRIGEYPAAKKRNKAVVEALQKAETNLDHFWAKIDELLITGLGSNRFLAGPRTLQRTSDWIEPVKEKAKSTTITSSSVDSITQPLSSVFLTPTTGSDDVSARNEILAAKAKTKVKAKSRGTPGPQASDVQETTVASPVSRDCHEVQDDQPTFAVDSRALKVFRVLFFDPSAHTTPGEVAWNDFIHAMGSAGFAAQKLYGSVWHFQPTNLDAERSIQFHEPHPHGKLPFLTARRYGRRLTRAYGWVGGMFWLKPKPNVKDTA